MIEIVTEDVEVLIEHYPNHKALNRRLLIDADSCTYDHSYKTNVWGKHSDWNVSSPHIKVIQRWVKRTILSYLERDKKFWDQVFWEHVETWFARYDLGDYTKPHSHMPYHFGWVYFVKTPIGSSPLVFHNRKIKIKAEEGKLVIFPAILVHSVPRNNCRDRVVLSGNVGNDFSKLQIKTD